MKRLFINDYGLVNAMGTDKASIATNWQHGVSPGMVSSDEFSPGRPLVLGRIPGALPTLPDGFEHFDCRNNRLLLFAYEQIASTFQALLARYKRDRIGIVLATCTSGIANAERAVKAYRETGKRPPEFCFHQQAIGAGACFLREHLELTGPAVTVSTACSSSANAFATARRLLLGGYCDAVIVGGTDTLCQLTIQGFASLEAVSAERCQPFSRQRKGINIGEASALFLLSSTPSDTEFLGMGCANDAYHISAPAPDGRGARESIRQALHQAGLGASQIDYINLHGTGTVLNDPMEGAIIGQLFPGRPLCSSTKSLTGHTLAAASAVELALCAMLLDSKLDLKVVPAQVWDGDLDPSCGALNIVSADHGRRDIQACMSNSFAFGGNNTSLIIGRNLA